MVSEHREMVGRSFKEQGPTGGSITGGTHLANGGRVHEVSGALAGGQVRVVRYGNTLSGTVERTIRPGLMSRTFVSGGHVLYTHVYQRHVWHQFGRAFATRRSCRRCDTPGPTTPGRSPHGRVRSRYTWGWQVQPWYPMYGSLFTPYPVYTSPDLWMTDYIIAQSMQTAYQAQTVAPASQPAPQGAPAAAPASDSSVAAARCSTQRRGARSATGDVPPAPQSSGPPSAPVALPPAITPQVKAQLNTPDQSSAAGATGRCSDAGDSDDSEHSAGAQAQSRVLSGRAAASTFRQATANSHCSLSANDYIKRTGEMSNDDWMIPVVVELSRPSDCPEGLRTRIGLNDLNAMENEQEAQVLEAMQAASKSMGPNGPPSGPGAHPTLIADGSAAPDPSALEAIRPGAVSARAPLPAQASPRYRP